MSVMQFDPFGDPFRQLDRVAAHLMGAPRAPMRMPMDVWREQDGYHVALDLPGVDPGTVDVTAERNVLTIRAERRTPVPEAAEVLIAERPQGSFTRQLQIGDGLDAQRVAARYEGGVLHLLVPVAESAKPRRIAVETGGEARELDLDAGHQTVSGESRETVTSGSASS
jgi:HSP20 family protein